MFGLAGPARVPAGGPRSGGPVRAARLPPWARNRPPSSTTITTITATVAISQMSGANGHTVNAILPTIRPAGIGPKYRLSSESVRLSPITKYSPGGTL